MREFSSPEGALTAILGSLTRRGSQRPMYGGSARRDVLLYRACGRNGSLAIDGAGQRQLVIGV